MRKIVSIALAMVVASVAMAEDIRIKSGRPSRILTFLASLQGAQGKFTTLPDAKKQKVGSIIGTGNGEDNIVPKGVSLVAHDSIGILTITGPKDLVENVKKYIDLFDVVPRKISASVNLSCPVDGQESMTHGVVMNNKSWSMSDDPTDINLSMAARLNDDGTLTTFLSVTRGGKNFKYVVRAGSSDTVMVRLTNVMDVKTIAGAVAPIATLHEPLPDKPKSAAPDLDEPEAIILIKLKVLEDGTNTGSSGPVPPRRKGRHF